MKQMERIILSRKVTIKEDVIHVENSHGLKCQPHMWEVIRQARMNSSRNHDFCKVLLRSNMSLINEWRVHNLLYDLHLFRKHTKDVDFTLNKWYVEVLYAIVSPLYFYH